MKRYVLFAGYEYGVLNGCEAIIGNYDNISECRKKYSGSTLNYTWGHILCILTGNIIKL